MELELKILVHYSLD